MSDVLLGFQIIFGVSGVAFGLWGVNRTDQAVRDGELDAHGGLLGAIACVVFGGSLALVGVLVLVAY